MIIRDVDCYLWGIVTFYLYSNTSYMKGPAENLAVEAIPALVVATRVRRLRFGLSVAAGCNEGLLLVLHPSIISALGADPCPPVLLVIFDALEGRLSGLDAMFLQLLLVLLAQVRQCIQQPLLNGFLSVLATQLLADIDDVGNALHVWDIFFGVVSHCNATLTTSPASSPNPVDVDRSRIRNVVIDDSVDAPEVHAARQQIRRHEDPDFTFAEVLHDLGALTV